MIGTGRGVNRQACLRGCPGAAAAGAAGDPVRTAARDPRGSGDRRGRSDDFQSWTDLDLSGYQGYDKALDVYYLTIAYLATIRNWTNLAAFEVSRFLIYYRLVGVLLFEFLHSRALLLIFPNTFEYFFNFYEVVRLRWDPVRMSRRVVYGAAAAIWVVIKLPHEYWIHVAQLDVTDELSAHRWVMPVLAVVIVAAVGAGWWIIVNRLPPADHRPALEYPSHEATVLVRRVLRTPIRELLDWVLVEKIIMVSLVSVIFAQILPDVRSGPIQMTAGVAFLITSNAVVSELLIRRGVSWSTTARQFGAMAAINAGLAVVGYVFGPDTEGGVHLGNALFFL